MATFMAQAVDIYEDFEDASLATGLTETDVDGLLTVNSANRYYAGSRSMEVTVGTDDDAYIEATPAANNLSVGFWYYTNNPNAWDFGNRFALFGHAAMAEIVGLRDLYDDDRVVEVRWGSAPYSTSQIGISSNTWYWITCQYNRNATSYVRVYDTSHNIVGTVSEDLSDIPADYAPYFRIGRVYGALHDTAYWDDLVIDYTNYVFPLLGWSVGGGTVVPQIMQFYRRLRS